MEWLGRDMLPYRGITLVTIIVIGISGGVFRMQTARFNMGNCLHPLILKYCAHT